MQHEVLAAVNKGEIDVEQAADLLETTPRRVRQMLTVWSGRLPTLIRTLDAMSRPFLSREDKSKVLQRAADALEVSPRQVRRLLSVNNVDKKPLKTTQIRHEKAWIAQNKWDLRTRAALSFIAGSDNVESASLYADVTERQMYRWVHKMLDPTGVDIRDLRGMRLEKRQKLASKIEAALDV